MANERKKQQKRQKKAQKRQAKRHTRKVRSAQTRQVKSAGLSDILEWPLAEAWIGTDWHEQGARFPAVATREHASGDIAAAVFDIDLSGPGVVKAELLTHIDRNQLQFHLARISEHKPLMEVSPSHVLAAVETGWQLAEDADSIPGGFARARALFGELEPDGRITLETGTPPVVEKKPGLFARLFGKRD